MRIKTKKKKKKFPPSRLSSVKGWLPCLYRFGMECRVFFNPDISMKFKRGVPLCTESGWSVALAANTIIEVYNLIPHGISLLCHLSRRQSSYHRHATVISYPVDNRNRDFVVQQA